MGRRAGKAWGPGGRRLRNVDETFPDYTADEIELGKAMERHLRRHRRKHFTCRDVLDVARALGYRKVCDPGPLPK